MKRVVAMVMVGGAVAALSWAADPGSPSHAASVPLIAAVPIPGPPPPTVGTTSRMSVVLRAEPVAEGVGEIVLVTAPTEDDRLFLVDRVGRILVVADGAVLPYPFLDLRSVVGSVGVEQGLVGLVFHPEYFSNGRFFVYFTNQRGDSRLVEYRVSERDPNVAESRAVRLVMAVDQPHQYHNAGMLLFGPDGMLYISFGDGGGTADTFGNGQRADTLLGTISRISVDGPMPYAVPADNPFADADDGAAEVWFWGLRNPWRFWIDEGLVYIGDVGQSGWEEIDVVPLDAAGTNFGWPMTEGFECFEEECDLAAFEAPALAYPHAEGCAVVGGVVSRSASIPELDGHYFYADFCAGWIRSFRFENGEVSDERDWSALLGDLGQILSFGTDASGDIYVTTPVGVYRLAAER